MRNIDRYTRDYLELPFEAEQVRYRQKQIREILDRYPHHTCLEVGCGLHSIAEVLSPDDQLTIVEPSDHFFQNASQQYRDRKTVTLIQGELEAVAARLSPAFDFICVSSLLHELEQPLDFLQCIHAICKPETVVHINVPNANSLHRELAVAMGLIQSVEEASETQKRMQQSRCFSEETLVRFVESAGFRVVDKGGYFIKPFTHGQMQRMLDAGILTKAMLDGFYALAKKWPGLGSEIYVNMVRK